MEQVLDGAGLTNRRARIIVDIVFSTNAETMHQREKVELRGFGSFRIRRRRPRRGRNSKTGQQVNVPSKRIPYFKPAKELNALINPEPAHLVLPPLFQ